METKICKTCNQEKSIEDFHNHKNTFDRKRKECKSCRSIEKKEYYLKNKEKVLKSNKNYRVENTERVKLQRAKYYEENEDKLREYSREYQKKNKQEISKKRKEYNRKNKKRIAIYHRDLARNNIQVRIQNNIRRQINHRLENYSLKKQHGTLNLLDCGIEVFIKHLESQFLPNMSWDNHGKGDGKWHIDHILPCELFDLSDERQLRICFHYTNLRPFWGINNSEKSDILPDGRSARNLTPQEKLDYLRSIGIDI